MPAKQVINKEISSVNYPVVSILSIRYETHKEPVYQVQKTFLPYLSFIVKLRPLVNLFSKCFCRFLFSKILT